MSETFAGRRVLMLLDNACTPDWRVLREAESLGQAGASVRILCWDREASAPETESRGAVFIERVRTPAQRQRGIRQLDTLVKFYREATRRTRHAKFDVVHAHDLLMLPLGAFLARRLHAGLIYDAHEIYHIMESARYPQPLLAGMARMERWLIRHSVDAFVTVSQQRVDDYWGGVLDDRPAYVVGNWYDPVAVSPDTRRRAREELGLSPDMPVLLYAGGFAAERRLDLLMQVASLRPQWTLLVAGRGDHAVARELAGAARAAPNLRVLGWQDQPGALYAAADAFYYVLEPSHPYTRFAASNTLYLAIARELPLITAALGEPGRIMRDIAPELVLDPPSVDTLARALDFLSGPDRGRRIAESMRGLQRYYGWNRTTHNLHAAYGAALSRAES